MILKIDKNMSVPIYIQIKDEIIRLIKEGKVGTHEKLPPSRELATSLNISRNSVIQSYSLLEAERFIYSAIGKGTFVNQIYLKKATQKDQAHNAQKFNFDNLLSISWKRFETSLMSGIDKLITSENFEDYITFDSPNPDVDILPIENFKNSLINSIKRYGSQLFSSIKTEGFYPFREYLAKYMVKRGIYTNPENVLVTSGIQQGLSLIGRLLIDPGSIFYMGSFSETLFPGIRLSWIIASKQIIKKLSSLKESSDIYTNLILQAAVLDFMGKGYFEKHLKRLNRMLVKRNEALNYALSRHFPNEAKWSNIKGGPYRWIDIPSDIDSFELLLKSREKGVLFAPDRIFAIEDWGNSGFRLKFSNINEEKIWTGIEIISKALKSMLSGG